MYVKMIGMTLLLLGGYGLGSSKSRSLRKKLDDLKLLRQIFLLLKGEITYGNSSLPAACRIILRKFPEPFHGFLEELSSQMEQARGESFASIFQNAVDHHLTTCRLCAEEKEELLRMGGSLGFLDRQNQIRQLELYEKELQRTIEDYQKELPEKRKLCQTLGIITGIFLAVLLC